MAYKPSAKQNSDALEMDLDIRPIMNLMVVLIPLLLQGAEWVKLGTIDINAPPTKSVGDAAVDQNDKKEDKKIGLKIAVTRSGITLANAVVVLGSDTGEEGQPTVPNNEDGTYNIDLLRTKLIDIKTQIAGKGFSDQNRAVITASNDIEYKHIVELIDNIQTFKDDEGNERALFPEVNFGSVIQ